MGPLARAERVLDPPQYDTEIPPMPDISRRLERAEKHLQKGRQDAALEEYLGALQEDPGNDVVRQSAADLCVALGHAGEAAKHLSTLFDHYSSIGDTAKAISTYKKLVRAGAPSVDQTFKYGQLVEKSNRHDAMEAYKAALHGFDSQKRKQEGLAVLKRIIALDPSEEHYKQEGELAAELGDGKTAAVAFHCVGMFQAKAGADPLPWYQRAHQMDSRNADVALSYGKALHAAGLVQPAITVLEPFATAEKSRIEEREAYADALVAAKRLVEAEPLIWELFERDPKEVSEVGELIAALLDEDHQAHALELAHKLEVHQLKSGNQREFVALMKDISDKHRAGIEFLGYHFLRTRRRLTRMPRKKSLTKLKDAIRQRTRHCNGESLPCIICDVNAVTRGWFEYFKHSYRGTFRPLDGWIRMRLRRILRRRSGRHRRERRVDHQRWTNAFFAAHGLLSMTEAHAALCQSARR